MVPEVEFHIFTIHFEPLKRGQPLYKGCLVQRCPYMEVSLYGGSTAIVGGSTAIVRIQCLHINDNDFIIVLKDYCTWMCCV